jgi:Ca2+-binding EF-hand superfamily protein
MLTAGQLSDLFRRLDRDGNGKLSLDEFLELSSKLKWDTHEDTMARYDYTMTSDYWLLK